MLKKKIRQDIYAIYTCIFRMPDLSGKKIEEKRDNLGLLAQAIFEHVWEKKFY